MPGRNRVSKDIFLGFETSGLLLFCNFETKMMLSTSVVFSLAVLYVVFTIVQSKPSKHEGHLPTLNRQKRAFNMGYWDSRLWPVRINWDLHSFSDDEDMYDSLSRKIVELEKGQERIIDALRKLRADKEAKPCQQSKPVTESANPSPTSVPEITPTPQTTPTTTTTTSTTATADSAVKFQDEQQLTTTEASVTTTTTEKSSQIMEVPTPNVAPTVEKIVALDNELLKNNALPA